MRDRLIELPIDDAILILKEEHKQRVDGYATHLSYGGKGDSAEEVSLDALEMAISALEQTKWISVKDRLPDKYRDEYGELIPFLVCVDETDYPCRALFDGKKWGDGVFLIPVTHWMPLPQPPKGE